MLDVNHCNNDDRSYYVELKKDNEVVVCINYQCDKRECPEGQVRDPGGQKPD